MASILTEGEVEEAALAWLEELGYAVRHGPDIGPEGREPERGSNDEVLLTERLREALARLNPHLSADTLEDVLRKVQQSDAPSLVEENRRLHRYLVEGVPVEVAREDGSIGGDAARLVDFDDIEANDWLAVNQFTVIEQENNRRPDIVLFVNGLPLAVIELKNPGDENATLEGAFNQLQTYKDEIPSLFRANAALITSDGLEARFGSLTADLERFMPWRTVDGSTIAPKGAPELETVIGGVFEKNRFLALIRDFTVFEDTGAGAAKIVAGYHQFHAVRHAVVRTIDATAPEGGRRIGVIWHTQGSGKSLLMAFYAGQILAHPDLKNPTVVVITDRNDLDEQLFGTFSMCRDLLRLTPHQAEDREDLQKELTRPSGGVVFTTIQKFKPESGESDYPLLTDRRNVVVIADEAHRSQYGFRARVGSKTGEISYGFAKYLRDALPNASFIGFTGTPVEEEDVNTPAVFGEYIDVYDISRGVEDGATVPIYYESRLARIELDEAEKPVLDDEIADLTEDEAQAEQERLKRRWANVEAVVGTDKRLRLVARDLVEHFESRIVGMEGKAMVVCMSRRICVALYDEIVKLRPDWHGNDDGSGAIKIVMTGDASDPKDWQPHIRNKARRERLSNRFKAPDDALKIVIVRDMWLTGFNAPSLHTMYVDKPMRGHGLMQAIARVNRVFRDKPAGLIVDYIGIAQNLKSALGQYSGADRRHAGIEETEAVTVMREKYEIVSAMFHGFDYRKGLSGSPQELLAALAGAIEWVLDMQQRDAAKGNDRGRPETRSPPLQGRRAGALQGVCARRRQRPGARHPRGGGVLPDRPRGAGQARARRRHVLRRAGPGRPANRQPRGRLDRDRRHPRGRRAGDAGHLHSFRRVPRGAPGDGEEEPCAGSAAQAHRWRASLAKPGQCRADPHLLPTAGGGGRPLSQQCHHHGGGSSGTDRARQGHPRRSRARRGGRTQRGGDRLLRRPRAERERRRGNGERRASRHRP